MPLEPFEEIKNKEKFLYSSKDRIKFFLENLSMTEHRYQFGLITDEVGRLITTITDGDIRRAIMSGRSVDDTLADCGCNTPLVGKIGQDAENASILSKIKAGVKFLPIVDENHVLINIIIPKKEVYTEATALIMAGGFGKRLGNLTKNTPKPLLEINGKTLISNIIEKLEQSDINKIFVSVHYLANQIKDHIESLQKTTSFEFINEQTPLGTAGSISLIPQNISEPLLVTNADLITSLDFRSLLHFHQSNNFDATLVLVDYSHQIPFGVVEHNNKGEFVRCNEKPIKTYPVMAGIYCFSKDALSLIPRQKNQFLDMPDFIDLLKRGGLKIGVFPLHENWRDVGSPTDLELARNNSGKSED